MGRIIVKCYVSFDKLFIVWFINEWKIVGVLLILGILVFKGFCISGVKIFSVLYFIVL